MTINPAGRPGVSAPLDWASGLGWRLYLELLEKTILLFAPGRGIRLIIHGTSDWATFHQLIRRFRGGVGNGGSDGGVPGQYTRHLRELGLQGQGERQEP